MSFEPHKIIKDRLFNVSMAKSKLEKKIGFISRIKREIKEIKYVGFGHYLIDLTGYVMDKTPLHYHKENHTSKNSLLLHSNFQ